MDKSTLKYKTLKAFLTAHTRAKCVVDPKPPSTHLRIGDKKYNVFGGSYVIPEKDYSDFYALYYDHVFVNNHKEYITEPQLETGAIVIDLDFSYDHSICERQHDKDYTLDFVILCSNVLRECFEFEDTQSFTITVMEKPHVNRLEDGSRTKDGVHIHIGLLADKTIKKLMRCRMLDEIEKDKTTDGIFELPFMDGHTWDKVFDEGVSAGSVAWQLIGSSKPGNEAYEMSSMYKCTYIAQDNTFAMDEISIRDFNISTRLFELSVRNTTHACPAIHPNIKSEYDHVKTSGVARKNARAKNRSRVTLLTDTTSTAAAEEFLENDSSSDKPFIPLDEIHDLKTLELAMENNVLSRLLPTDITIREIHEYTQILPKIFYEPGSHVLNRHVAFALKHTSHKLFLSWILLRSKADDFDYSTITSLYNDWKQYFNVTETTGITKNSIIYWAKQYVPEEYERVKSGTINRYIDISLYEGQTDFDISMVLYQMYKDVFVCTSTQGRGCWYVFKNHRWKQNKQCSLRMLLSTEVHALYSARQALLVAELQQLPNDTELYEKCKKRSSCVGQVMQKLKRTQDKNNFIRESMELFYDEDFTELMDTRRNLFGFKNGVVDFTTNEFRCGYPQDYITKTCGVNYIPYASFTAKDKKIESDIIQFMKKLFPIEDVNRYMWDHAASALIGVVKNQTFNIYFGSGSNGKSLFVELMAAGYGEYKGTVPLSIVTEKRVAVGQTSSEIMQLKGVRYVVMDEISKGMKLNEGPMKAITSGDPLQGRSLFSESETFIPQFSLAVCTNTMFEVESTDDGTWRRFRKCDFQAKFVDKGDTNTYNSKYIFEKDKDLKDKLPKMAPIFMSMLVEKAFETKGIVKDSDEVLRATNVYKYSQNIIAAFIAERIIKTDKPTDFVGKTGLREEYKTWLYAEHGDKKMPKSSEIYDALDVAFGSCVNKRWVGVTFAKCESSHTDVNIDDIVREAAQA
jgi:P4 family phage/plasmid primase-like protien